jgi:excisionase family DNA binding protein
MYSNQFDYAEFLQKKYGTPLINKIKAANELSISRATIDRMRKDGQIKSKRIGKQVRFHVTEIARIVMSEVV